MRTKGSFLVHEEPYHIICRPCDIYIYLPALEEDKIRHPGRIPDQNRTGTDGTAAALPVQHTTTRGFHLHTYPILCDTTVLLLISTLHLGIIPVLRIRIRNPHGTVLILVDWIWIRIGNANPDPDWECGSGSGLKKAKMTHKHRKKIRNFMF
jgi:hypothetical protein